MFEDSRVVRRCEALIMLSGWLATLGGAGSGAGALGRAPPFFLD